MKIKISEATNHQIDYLVAKCLGYSDYRFDGKHGRVSTGQHFDPSTYWEQGGPIIDRLDGFELKIWLESKQNSKCEAHIHNHKGDWIAFGPTPLIAAMRCFVASKLGDEVDVPEDVE